MSDLENKFLKLEKKIQIAESQGQPIDSFVIEQIEILKKSLTDFINLALKKGYKRDDIRIGEIEVKQYQIMMELSKKINLPTDEYKKLIKDAQIRVLGEEIYKAQSNLQQ